ncbi:3593_t:CDS:2 [Cetraspora pellucida]|uniref:3593_t:CDS:1 n=1 Tax=Cetraspora pellucida TaxID=1433469 RepID=A0ACA9K2T3_9GLOM|nr:3593_t:CDS:2 [Cetraspora pellucida]
MKFNDVQNKAKTPNSFMIYQSQFVKQAKKQGITLRITEISKLVSMYWKKEKATYAVTAASSLAVNVCFKNETVKKTSEGVFISSLLETEAGIAYFKNI